MCSNPDTYEFRLSLDLPQQSAVSTDTFSALREVHEYSAENGPHFHTAAEMFDSLGNMIGPAMRTLRMAGSGFVTVELSDTQASMASILLPSGSCTKAA